MRPNLTHLVAIIDVPGGMRTGLALSCDVLEAANRAAQALGATAPFDFILLRPEETLPPGLQSLVLPGMSRVIAEEVEQKLASPGGRWVVETIKLAHDQGLYIATSCAGVWAAAAAGVLQGKVATTSWFLAAELAARHPEVAVEADCVLVESGSILTGGAAFAHADVMLAFVERFAGQAVADLCAKYLLLDRRRSQRPYLVLSALIQGDPSSPRPPSG